MDRIQLKRSVDLFTHVKFNIKQDTVLIDEKINEYIYVDKSDAVGIIPIVNNEVWLVEQYRHSVGMRLLEIPAGKVEKNETPKEAALRELKEETGLVAKDLELFTTIFIHPSLCNEVVHIFLAKEFLLQEKQSLDSTEFDLNIKKVSFSDLSAMLIKNKILSSPDGYILSLLLLKQIST